MMRRWRIFLLMVLCSITSVGAETPPKIVPPKPQKPTIIPSAPTLGARAYLLMDYNSGQVIVQQNKDERLHPASLTKIMTSYVVAHELAQGNIKLSDQVTISEAAWAKKFADSSLMFIEVGKAVSVDDLHHGIIIQSGNDASVAVAEHIAGSEDAFAQLMNHHVKELGLANTHFVNSTGLPDPKHYASAYDLALLARALIQQFPEIYKSYSQKEFTYNRIKQHNRNALLWEEGLGVDGVKTGHTSEAGYCLVSSAVKDGMRLIAVVMGSKSELARKQESKTLLNYGFRYYETIKSLQAGASLAEQRVWKGDITTLKAGVASDVYLTVPRGKAGQIETSFNIQQPLQAPISKGQAVGTVSFKLEGKDVHSVPLIALDEVQEGNWWRRTRDSIEMKVSRFF